MNVSDYVKEHIYMPYFRRQSKEIRLQQILLGLGIGLALIALGAVAWHILKRHSCDDDSCCDDSSDDSMLEEAGV